MTRVTVKPRNGTKGTAVLTPGSLRVTRLGPGFDEVKKRSDIGSIFPILCSPKQNTTVHKVYFSTGVFAF